MPKYIVEVEFTSRRHKDITVYAADEADAESKACDIVMAWDGVEDAEALNVDED